MADTKITALTALTAADPANDVIPIVDVSDTSMAASGTTKKISVNNILGASGTATLASATITGDLTVDTSTLKVDSTLNKVGIGVATLTGLSTLNVAGDIALTSDLVVKNSGGTVQGYIFGSSGLNYRVVASNPHVWQEGGTEQMRLNTTGNLVLKGGTTGANGVGLTFPATQVASSDANCLDDYEEGTWTPTVTAETGTIGTTTVISANYTKIGRLVNVNFDVRVDSIGTGTGGLKVSLPFSSSGEQNSGVGREIINTGSMCQVTRSTATTVYVYFYNNLTVIANTNRVVCNYTFNV